MTRDPIHFRSRFEICALAAAVLLTHWLFLERARLVPVPDISDADAYYKAASDVARHGLFSDYAHSGMRTYGYPLVLSLIQRAAHIAGVHPVWLAFEVQLLSYLAAVWFLRTVLSRHLRSPALLSMITAGWLLNGFVLAYSVEVLTESLSITLLVLLLAGMAGLLGARSTTSFAWALLAGSFLAGFAIMVRPANAYLLPAWLLAVALALLRRAGPALGKAVFLGGAVCLMAVPLLPQVYVNARFHGRLTPLPASLPPRMVAAAGIRDIKFTSAVILPAWEKGEYPNPLLAGTRLEQDHPERWYARYPLRGMLTLALHLFNLLDQDLPFPYATDVVPWYRWPASVASQLILGLGVLGLVLLFRAAREAGERKWMIRACGWLLLALLCAHAVQYGWGPPECRYGLPALALLLPLAMLAIWQASHAWPPARMVRLTLVMGCYLAAACTLSGYIQAQAPLITRMKRYHEAADVAVPLPTPSAWLRDGAADDGCTIALRSVDGTMPATLAIPIPLRKSTVYKLRFEAATSTWSQPILNFDLFNYPGYDLPMQDGAVEIRPLRYRRFEVFINAGPAAPERGWLRFFTVSSHAISIRNIRLSALAL